MPREQNQNATLKMVATGIWYACLFALIGLLLLSFVSSDKELARMGVKWGLLLVGPFIIYSAVLNKIFGTIVDSKMAGSTQDKI